MNQQLDNSIFCGQRGFTLVESLLVCGLSAMITLAAISLKNSVSKNTENFDDLFTETSDNIIAERYLLYDLRTAFPSFNNLEVKDDDGKQFFELISDVPGASVANPKRTITLGPSTIAADKQTQELVLMTSKSFAAIYDPVAAYDNDPILRTVTFNSVNRSNYADGLFTEASDKWIDGSLWLLYSPVALREPAAPLTDPARWPIFVGKVTGSALNPEPLATTTVRTLNGRIVRNSHPADSALTIDSADLFFRKLYPASGGPPPVFLMPVSFVKYNFVREEVKPGVYVNKLFRRAWKNGAFEPKGQMIAKDIQKILITRDSVTIPSVGAQVVRN